MNATIDTDELKSRVDLADLIAQDGHELRRSGGNLVCRCMFHDEKSGSFTVYPDGRFKCFGCGKGGDVIDYVQETRGLSFNDAVERLGGRAGVSSILSLPQRRAPQVVKAASSEVDRSLWPELRRGTLEEMQAVADLRRVDVSACRVADSVGLLLFGEWKEQPAWFICDSERRNAQARRMDGQPYEHTPKPIKAWTLPKASGATPIGVKEAAHYPSVLLVEGGPDILAALHFMHLRRDWVSWCPVGFLGAGNRLAVDALEALRGKRVRIFPHLDAAGERAAETWAVQLRSVGCDVDAFSFEGLRRSDGSPVGDLNDACDIHAEDAAELEGILF